MMADGAFGLAMGYLSIDNLYKNQSVLMTGAYVWALEKVHGTSAHIRYKDGKLIFFSGGEKHANFVALFNQAELLDGFRLLGFDDITVYGEAYGGKQQGMRATYGDELRFIAFDVKVGDEWLTVPRAAATAASLGFEFVPYRMVPATALGEIDAERDRPSEVAIRRGMGDDKIREGVVLRPLVEVVKNNGQRVIAKHKCEAFSERATPQKVVDPAKLQVLKDAAAIADEWVTPMRLAHVVDKLAGPFDMTRTSDVIRAMIADIYREAAGEVVESREANAAIGKNTALLFKRWLNAQIAGPQ